MGQIIQSLDRGLQLLDMLAQSGGSIGATEAAHALRVDRSSAFRLLHTLLRRGYVSQVENGRYRLGPVCVRLSYLATMNVSLAKSARAVLEELADRSGRTVHLAVLSDDQVVLLDRAEGSEMVAVATRLGMPAPVHCSATGKAIAAYLPPDDLRKILDRSGLECYTRNTITSADDLEVHLRHVREQGFALDEEERYEGVVCAAAPVFDSRAAVVAAIGISAPSTYLKADEIAELEEMVTDGARRVSQSMGYEPG